MVKRRKLSERVKSDIATFVSIQTDFIKQSYLPDIEKLEKEKEELIKIIAKLSTDFHDCMFVLDDTQNKLSNEIGSGYSIKNTVLWESWIDKIKDAEKLLHKLSKEQE
jgi:hypothetical protein